MSTTSLRLKTAKGISKAVVDNNIVFQDYLDCLYKIKTIWREMKVFKSKNHPLCTVAINKLALSHKDDKRITEKYGVNTLAYGHIQVGAM